MATTKKEVATTDEAQMPAALMHDMEADAAKYADNFTTDQLVIPRMSVLNDLSPQVKERNAEYVAGAKAGMIYNNVTGTLDGKITFVPAHYSERYIAWQEKRGGLIDTGLTKAEVEDKMKPNGLGQWTGLIVPRGKEDPVRVDVILTPEWLGIASGAGWGPMPVAIAFPLTKSKASRLINTAIALLKVKGKNGMFRPSSFYHTFELGTKIETADDNEWFGWSVDAKGVESTDPQMVVEARELKASFEAGDAVVDDAGARG